MPLFLNDSRFLPFNLLTLSHPHPDPPPKLPHPSLPSRLYSLHPSFALLLSSGGNYLHKSFFALWFAPFHKWRLSLFNRGGFASHVKAYNVAGPRFLHTPPAPPGLLSPSLPPFHSAFPPSPKGGGAPRLRLTGPEEACCGSDSTPIDLTDGDQEVVKNHLW